MASKGGKQAKKQAKGVSPISGTAPPVETRFQKGQSGNPHGRPKDLKQLRALIQSLGHDIVEKETGLTRVEVMVRGMYTSRNPADRKEILRYGWGEPPQTLNVKIEDVDAAIKRELDRVAGRGQTEDAGTAEADADASAGGTN